MKLDGERVLVLYNEPRLPPSGVDSAGWESEHGVLDEVRVVAEALDRLGVPHREAGAKAMSDVPGILAGGDEQLVFNLVEGFARHPEEALMVPAVCRAYGRSATGCSAACQMLATDKWRAKSALLGAGVAVPRGVQVQPGAAIPRGRLGRGPYIVKPALGDGSEGIDASSVVRAAGPALRAAVQSVHRRFRHPALVEAFVDGREFNVSILQRGRRVDVLPIAEIDFSAFGADRPRIISYSAKWHAESFEYKHTPRILPAQLTKKQSNRIRACARAAWDVMGCADYARVDLRMDADGKPVVIEVNPNPDISPEGGFAAALAAARIPFERFVLAVLTNARARLPAPEVRPAGEPAASLAVRATVPADREAILRMVVDTGFFRPDEIAIAQEVLDDALTGRDPDYLSFVVDEAGVPAGWVCFGPTPCTLGTYDIYWIVVDPRRQSRGLGRALLRFAESEIRRRGGRVAVIETSGRPIYQSTRGFYLKCGYTETARLPEFYAPGDDKLVYTRRVDG